MTLLNQFLLVITLFVNVPNHSAKTDKSPEVSLKQLLGQWRVKEIHFSDTPKDANDKFSSNHMHRGIVRYDFKEAGEFTYVVPNKLKNKPEDGRYWTWTLDDKKQGFAINQLSPQNPPFDFGVTAKIEKITAREEYMEITLAVVYHADNTKATIVLTNLRDANWDLPPSIHNNK